MTKDTSIKLGVSAAALVLLVVRLARPDLTIDAISVGLLVVGVLPWASTFVTSFKAPGGWEVKFHEMESKLQKVIDTSSEDESDASGTTTETLPLSDSEANVLRALTRATVPLRSVSGMATDLGVGSGDVEVYLDTLEKRGLATTVHGKTGIRWGITPSGRKHLERHSSQ